MAITYINGYTVSQFQRCERVWAIGRTHNLTKWRPQSLLAMCLRHAIFSLSNGGDLAKVSVTATSHFMANARQPGLDVLGVDTYTLSLDYCAIIRNILEHLSRVPLVMLREIQPVHLTSTIAWQFLSHMDDTGTLHRWKFVDHLDEDITGELHSWEVFGDIAAADAPMVLHLVAIGQRKGCHQYSPWCKIYSHPKLAHVYRFQKRKGLKLEGEWKPVWFSDNSSNNPKEWVDLMYRDNVLDGLIRHISIKDLSQEYIKLFERDALIEGRAMEQSTINKVDPRTLQMWRYACDHPFTCPHQFFCYSSNLTLDSAGIYTRRLKEEVAHVAAEVVG